VKNLGEESAKRAGSLNGSPGVRQGVPTELPNCVRFDQLKDIRKASRLTNRKKRWGPSEAQVHADDRSCSSYGRAVTP